ncbi:MAG TPA: tetratricopeptide repeat protein [Polyangiaceae bacterium]
MILYIAAAAFKLWMLVDAMKRRVDNYWYFIIAMLPFGDWAYFFVHKLPELRQAWANKRTHAPLPLESLRYDVQVTPSAKNRLALGSALYDQGQLPDAKREFLAVLRTHPEDAQAQYGLALTLKAEGQLSAAVEQFERLLERSPGYDEYAAMLELIDTHKRINEPDVALALLEQLVRSSPRTKHQLALSEHLVDMQRFEEARQMLDAALTEYEHLPPFAKRREARYIGACRALRRHLSD